MLLFKLSYNSSTDSFCAFKAIGYTIVLIVFFIFGINKSSGQDLRFKHLTTDNGLSQNNIYCITQDSKGFIWIGTNKGLNKYDGYEFRQFSNSPLNDRVLLDNVIECITEDSQGNIWIGTGSSGLHYYNTLKDKFTKIKFDSIPANVIGRNRVRSIIEGQTNNIWFTAGNSINKLDPNSNKIFSYKPSHIIDENTSQMNISILFEDSKGNMWFGTTTDGLGLFNRQENSYTYFKNDKLNRNSISDNSITAIYESSDSSLWIGTYNGGFNRFNYKSKQFTRFYPNRLIRESLTIKTFIEDDDGNLWLGTRNGLYVFNIPLKTYQHHYYNASNPNSLSHNNINTLFKDSKGNFWLGTKNGIDFLNIDNMAFKHYRTSDSDIYSLNKHRVNDIIHCKNGYLWFGTSQGGLNVLDPKTGKFKYYTNIPGDNQSLSSNNAKVIREDQNGNIWIGTFQGGLNKFDKKTEEFIHYKIYPELELVHQQAINSILFDKLGGLWICAHDGIKFFNKKTESFTHSGLEQNSEAVYGIEDQNGDFWVAFRNRKLYRFNPLSRESKDYILPIYSNTSIIKTIVEDNDLLWFGTSNSGLLRFEKSSGNFKVFMQDDGLPDNGVLGIIKDRGNVLWLSTRDGLSKFKTSTNKFSNYYKENGLQNNQFTRGSLKTSDGEIYFGDLDGAISFRPDDIPENLAVSPVVFTDFTIFNKNVQIGGNDPILSKHISEATNISLKFSHSSFTFAYAALDYALSEKIQYAYKMEGFEENWNYVNDRRYASYTNLSPGNYTFRVKAADSGGEWNEPASIEIQISPPFWQSWWFISTIFAIFGFVIWHTAKHISQKRNLLEAKALANKTQLKLLRNQMNPHFLLNAFSAIRALVLIDKNQAWEMISKLSEYFRYVLLNYKREQDTLNDEIDAVTNYIAIQQICFHENLNVEVNIDEEAKKLIVPAFILQPIVENALKYGAETGGENFKVSINAKYDQGLLTIDVSNSGTLNLKKSADNDESLVHGTSIKNLRKRMQLMFADDYRFKISERKGTVHAVLKINYGENGHKEHSTITQFADEI